MQSERRERLSKAIQYAIESDYSIYNRQVMLLNELRTYSNICVFGMGKFFFEGYPYVEELLRANYICDNNIDKRMEEKRETYGLTCIHVEELEAMDDVLTVIMVGTDYWEIKRQLDDKKIKNVYLGDLILNMYTSKHDSRWFNHEKENILKTLELFEDDLSQENYVEILCNRLAPHLCQKSFQDIKTDGEYFSTGILSFGSEEVFVDVGAYIGDTVEQFQKQVAEKNGGYKKIYAFELEHKFFEQLKTNVRTSGLENVEIFHKGISLEVDNQKSMANLDAVFEDKEFSIIKMDIEGAEWDALHGGKRAIKKWKPQMAVCLYHCLEDLWRIPQYIKELSPDYKLYLRHHSPVVWDSVLYATTNSR